MGKANFTDFILPRGLFPDGPSSCPVEEAASAVCSVLPGLCRHRPFSPRERWGHWSIHGTAWQKMDCILIPAHRPPARLPRLPNTRPHAQTHECTHPAQADTQGLQSALSVLKRWLISLILLLVRTHAPTDARIHATRRARTSRHAPHRTAPHHTAPHRGQMCSSTQNS